MNIFRNIKKWLTTKYPIFCDHHWLTTKEVQLEDCIDFDGDPQMITRFHQFSVDQKCRKCEKLQTIRRLTLS